MAKNAKNGFWKFEQEFSKHLATIITGGFALIVALIWKDAIRLYLDTHQSEVQSILNIGDAWLVQFLFAVLVTIGAVIGIIITKHLLKPKR